MVAAIILAIVIAVPICIAFQKYHEATGGNDPWPHPENTRSEHRWK